MNILCLLPFYITSTVSPPKPFPLLQSDRLEFRSSFSVRGFSGFLGYSKMPLSQRLLH